MKGLWNEERAAVLVMWLTAAMAVAMFIGVLTWALAQDEQAQAAAFLHVAPTHSALPKANS